MKTIRKQELFISMLLHALLLVAVYVFQGMIFTYMRLNGLVPLLLPVVTTGVAIYEGRYAGGMTGLFAGILCDISFNEPVGIFTVILTLTGLSVGAMADSVIMRSFVTYYLSCFVVLVFSAFVQMFSMMSNPATSIPLQPLLSTAIQQTIYSLVFALPIWFFVRALGKRAERVSPSGRPL